MRIKADDGSAQHWRCKLMRLAIAIVVAMLLTACGQTGDLFLPPEDKPETVARPTSEAEETTTTESQETKQAEQDDDEKTPAG